MLDSTNRPKGTQRRLARKQAQSAAQSASQSARPGAARIRREPASGLLRRAASDSPDSKPLRRRPRPEGLRALEVIHRRSAPRKLPRPAGQLQEAQRSDLSDGSIGSASRPERIVPARRPQSLPSQRVADASAQRTQRPGNLRGLGRAAVTASLVTQSRQARSGSREQPHARPVSPFVHLCRLLILGVGVGAIVGTVISVWNPALRNSAASPGGTVGSPGPAQQITPKAGSAPGTLASVSSLRIGREMTDLVAKVTPLTRDLTDLVPGVFLIDLDSGDYFSFNGSTAFSSASMIKLPILIAFLQDVDAGKIKLDEALSLQQADIAEGSGDMQYSAAGTEFTALDTVTNMIIHSDNTATNMVVRRLGGSEVLNQRFRQWGLQQTLLRKPLPDLEGLNTTSPKELVSLMALLNEGKLVSMKSRDRAFDILRRTVTDTLLPSVIAPGTTVAHKTGDIGSLVGDVGVVDLPSGRHYAVAVMVKRPHNDGRAQDLIRQIAALAYEQFGGKPTLAPSPVAAPPAQLAPGVNPTQPGVPPGMVAPALPGAAAPGQQIAPALPTALPEAVTPAPFPESVVTPEAAAPALPPDSNPTAAPAEAQPAAEGATGTL